MLSLCTLRRRARWIFSPAPVVVLFLVALTLSALPAVAAEPTWIRPVPGAVVRTYLQPPARFAAGHRGVDFAAPAGTPVRAANAGTVTFAGTVAGALHVVVAHTGGIRTSYSFLARVDVRPGAAVARGAVLGVAGNAGPGHGARVLHLGARSGATYFDPMSLFGPTDLTRLVHLLPVDGPKRSDERPLRG